MTTSKYIRGQRMVGIHLRVPVDIRDFYMAQDHMSDAMREALRKHMEEQLQVLP